MAACPHCAADLPSAARFCGRCGRVVTRKVAGMGTAIVITLVLILIVAFLVLLSTVSLDRPGPTYTLPVSGGDVRWSPGDRR